MKKWEKLAYLKDNYFGLFLTTRQQSFNDLSDQQTMFCCCGRLATGLHESNCTKFNNKVDVETDKILMIGDASGKEGQFSDSDKKCAENAGYDYMDVNDFIKDLL